MGKASDVCQRSHSGAWEGAGLLPSWTAKTLTALLLREVSGNRKPQGQRRAGLNPKIGHIWVGLLWFPVPKASGGQRRKKILYGRQMRGQMGEGGESWRERVKLSRCEKPTRPREEGW